jgi:hypothetical protein
METEQKLKEIHANKNMSIKVIAAENIFTLAKVRAEAYQTKVIKEAEAYKTQQELLADNNAKIMSENADSRLAVAKDKSQALIKEAGAEERSSTAMEGMRRHEEKMKLADSMQELASKGHMIVSGKNGQQVLDYYNNTLDLVAKR